MAYFQVPKRAILLPIVLLLMLVVSFPAQAASTVTYEVYTLLPGDTRENLALRHGLQPHEIMSIDNGSWQAGKRVALPKESSEASGAASKNAVNEPNAPRMASVTRGRAEIRAEAGKGDTLFRPKVGTKVIVVKETATHYGVMMADRSTGWVEKSALSLEETVDNEWLEGLLAGARTDVVQEAFRYLGIPYRYGGNFPKSTDCSLLVQRVFQAKGIKLPRTAATQSNVGKLVKAADVQPGDRLYFVNKKGRIDHTGIYIGAGQFIHASSKRGRVAVDNLAGALLSRLVSIRRS